MIDILPDERYEELRGIFNAEGYDIPSKGLSNILFKEDDSGKIESFIVVEHLLRVGQIWSESADATIPLQFIRYLLRNIPKESSVIVIASDSKYESLCEKLGMRELKGKLYRRDF